ncbi:molecular chaperone [Burkholderia metallica]|uniref:fimbrial biogenesis chaperone n=1 Tax=Burkholderia metallica TaxID=488729 RepID=UPI00157B7E48|nr:fimbria/pilus periplasmic chaperone [Burkholderia metallica]NTZ88384.1 molecular chaperone [Burkholderia metallica]
MLWQRVVLSAVAAVLLVGLPMARASVVISGTRVIYPAEEREITVKLSNEGDTPALVQVWLDAGDPKPLPAEANVPFTLTPPLFRMDPKKGQTLRLIYTGQPLPQDRESVFWLNVLEVPPKTKETNENENIMKLAFRYRIKLFFRPKGLPENLDTAAAKLQWRVVRNGGDVELRADNPGAYHVTVVKMETAVDGKAYQNDVGGMIAPRDGLSFSLKEAGRPSAAAGKSEIRYRYLNDYGAEVDKSFGAEK